MFLSTMQSLGATVITHDVPTGHNKNSLLSSAPRIDDEDGMEKDWSGCPGIIGFIAMKSRDSPS